jgi:hypothetical protein
MEIANEDSQSTNLDRAGRSAAAGRRCGGGRRRQFVRRRAASERRRTIARLRMSLSPTDSINLTKAQRKAAWRDLYVKSLNQKKPAGFNATVGAAVPDSVTLAPITDQAANDVPALRPYNFAMLQHKLLIVNPVDKKIAEVISR